MRRSFTTATSMYITPTSASAAGRTSKGTGFESRLRSPTTRFLRSGGRLDLGRVESGLLGWCSLVLQNPLHGQRLRPLRREVGNAPRRFFFHRLIRSGSTSKRAETASGACTLYSVDSRGGFATQNYHPTPRGSHVSPWNAGHAAAGSCRHGKLRDCDLD